MVQLSDAFWTDLQKHTGLLNESGGRWVATTVSELRQGIRRLPPHEAANALLSSANELSANAAAWQRAIARANAKLEGRPLGGSVATDKAAAMIPKRGRPLKLVRVPPRAHRAFLQHGDIELARQDILSEERPPARMDWGRYFLIYALAAAWKRRLNRAKGRPMSFSNNGDDRNHFVEAARIMLHAAGRDDSSQAVIEAIKTARKRIFAL